MVKSLKTISLNGNWSMRAENWEEAVPARVPGDIISDLIAAGKAADPYYRDQELQVLKLAETEYIYEKQFDLPDEVLSSGQALLRFEGIDTLADIWLNDRHIASTDNMHRIWEFPVRDFLVCGDNLLRVVFHSPTVYIRQRYEEHLLDGTSDAMRGFPYLRKAHYMFGWDWGARLPGGGLFRNVSLVVFDCARLDGVYIRQTHEGGKVFLTAGAELQYADRKERFIPAGLALEGEVFDPEGTSLGRKRIFLDRDGIPDGKPVLFELPAVKQPQLWYPAGYGTQPLYTVKVRLLQEEQELDCW